MTTRIIQSIACASALLFLAGSPLAAHAETREESIAKQPGQSIAEPIGESHTGNPGRFFENTPQTNEQSAFHVSLGTRILYVSLLADTKGLRILSAILDELPACQNPVHPVNPVRKRPEQLPFF